MKSLEKDSQNGPQKLLFRCESNTGGIRLIFFEMSEFRSFMIYPSNMILLKTSDYCP